MRLIVCIKQVPDVSDVKMDSRTNTLIREGVPSIVNPVDLNAVEEAIRLRDEYGGDVTVITMGPPQAERVLRKALSLGADRGVLISDRVFAGSDTLATSYILAESIEFLAEDGGFDLVLCGKQAIDGDTGQVPSGIATRLGIPPLTNVSRVELLDPAKKKIIVRRKLDGFYEIMKTNIPALISVVSDINAVRRGSLEDMIRAERTHIEILNNSSLILPPTKIGLDGSPTRVVQISPPSTRASGEPIMASNNAEEAATILVDRLFAKLQE